MKKVLMVIMLLSILLVGCSSGTKDVTKDVTVKWENGVMSIGGKQMLVDSYKGYEATINSGTGGLSYLFNLDVARDVTSLTLNTQGVVEEDMNKIKGKFYYTEYLGSKLTMGSNISGDDWMVCQVATNGTAATVVANYVSDYMDSLVLTNNQVYVDFGDFVFGNDYDLIEVRPDCALIMDVAKVSQDTYSGATESYTVMQGEDQYTLMKGSSKKYDYYSYNGITIQVAAGLDISNYIKFK